MKFAKELEDDLVPEWRLKYLNYKQGKKRITAIQRALRAVNRTPKTPARPGLPPQESSFNGPLFTQYDFNARYKIRELEASPDQSSKWWHWTPQRRRRALTSMEHYQLCRLSSHAVPRNETAYPVQLRDR